MSELINFRKNFALALQADGRSLNQFHRDTGMSLAYLSRVRSGKKSTGYDRPIVPSLETCEKIAGSLGFFVREMLLPPSQFRTLLEERRTIRNKKD